MNIIFLRGELVTEITEKKVMFMSGSEKACLKSSMFCPSHVRRKKENNNKAYTNYNNQLQSIPLTTF